MREILVFYVKITRCASFLLSQTFNWLIGEKTQLAMLLLGTSILFLAVFFCSQGEWKNISLSLGGSILASGLIFKLAKHSSFLDQSVGQAGVVFIGDRTAFGDLIGWATWIAKTDLRSEVIIIGKEHKAWLEDEQSRTALQNVLNKKIKVQFIFQAANDSVIDDSIEKFKKQLQKYKLDKFCSQNQLVLHKYINEDAEYGYYWNGKQLIVKFYFNFKDKMHSPFIVFDVKFSRGKFCIDDFTTYVEIIHYPRREMLIQAAHNMDEILTRCNSNA